MTKSSITKASRSAAETVVTVIPARYGSVRYPGKVTRDLAGKPLIQHVYERASLARIPQRVIVAVDHDETMRVVQSFGGEAVMTRIDHQNGTSRIAEVAEGLKADIIVNVQGDEAGIDPHLIDECVQSLLDDRECSVATAAAPYRANADPHDPNLVKVVVDQRRRALYFSRSPIPFDRAAGRPGNLLRHIGLYVYRRQFLLNYVRYAMTRLEQIECLEQLRILEMGERIAVFIDDPIRSESSFESGIDTEEQAEQFVRWYRNCEATKSPPTTLSNSLPLEGEG